LQREREEKRREEEEMGSLAEICLNFEKFKVCPSGGDDWLRSDF
jgi:hypothetical protein